MLACQRDAFTLPDDLQYLNCASRAPLLKVVEAAGVAGILAQRAPVSASPAEYFAEPDALRVAIGSLINCDPIQIALTPSVSYGVAIAANNLSLRRGQNIVMVEEEFPSDVYAWIAACEKTGATLRKVARAQSAARWTEHLVDHIDANTALVSLSTVHWTDGLKFDVQSVADRCREVGALFVLDATQSVGAMPFDFAAVQPDLLVCAGYKWLLGPYQMGFAALGERLLQGEPFEYHWSTRIGSEYTSNTAYQPIFRPGARRFDVGEQGNPITVPMLTAGITQVTRWGVPAIAEYLESLAQHLQAGLPETHFQLPPSSDRGSHILGIRATDEATTNAALQALSAADIRISRRGNVLRVSPHLHCDTADIDALLACLRKALS
jgi:selenocysteine lyase/cysteine desulfurase